MTPTETVEVGPVGEERKEEEEEEKITLPFFFCFLAFGPYNILLLFVYRALDHHILLYFVHHRSELCATLRRLYHACIKSIHAVAALELYM